MPGGDKKGPNGEGPMTGRGVGICAGYGVPGSANTSFGRGMGGGRGRGMNQSFGNGGGRGRRNQYYATGQPGWVRERNWDDMPNSPSPQMNSQQKTNEQEEVRYLKNQVENLSKMMEKINSKLDALGKKKDN